MNIFGVAAFFIENFLLYLLSTASCFTAIEVIITFIGIEYLFGFRFVYFLFPPFILALTYHVSKIKKTSLLYSMFAFLIALILIEIIKVNSIRSFLITIVILFPIYLGFNKKKTCRYKIKN